MEGAGWWLWGSRGIANCCGWKGEQSQTGLEPPIREVRELRLASMAHLPVVIAEDPRRWRRRPTHTPAWRAVTF